MHTPSRYPDPPRPFSLLSDVADGPFPHLDGPNAPRHCSGTPGDTLGISHAGSLLNTDDSSTHDPDRSADKYRIFSYISDSLPRETLHRIDSRSFNADKKLDFLTPHLDAEDVEVIG